MEGGGKEGLSKKVRERDEYKDGRIIWKSVVDCSGLDIRLYFVMHC